MKPGAFSTIYFSVVLFLVKSSFAQEPEYLWPTNASNWMTSSFCEARPDRFHAAIDIKTWNKTGYKVFAIRDGYISRVRVSPFGYGKALYHKLDTGETVVYAHLERFKPEIEQYAERQQLAAGKYRVDKYPSASVFPVKKGEVIAYTGETGIGVPHLHFEVRDAQNRPINPLSKGYVIDDVEAPTISRFGVVPLSPGSRIDEDFSYKFLKIVNMGRKVWKLDKPFSFDGEIGFIIQAYDGSGTVTNKFHVYEALLEIDGKPHLRIRYDRFSYGMNRHAVLEREYMVRRRHGRRFHRLFKDKNNGLGFYKSSNSANGRLVFLHDGNKEARSQVVVGNGANGAAATPGIEAASLTPGRHTFLVTLKDYFGNTSQLSGEFIAENKLKLAPQLRKDSDRLLLTGLNLRNQMPEGAAFEVYQKDSRNRSGWTLRQSLAKADFEQAFSQGAPLVISEAENAGSADLKFLLRTGNEMTSWPAYFFAPREANLAAQKFDLSIETDFFADYVLVRLNATLPVQKTPLVEVNTGDGSTIYPQLIQKSETEFLLPLELEKITGKNIRIVAQGESVYGQIGVAETVFDNIHIKKGQTRGVVSEDGRFSISFSSSALFQDAFVRIKQIQNREDTVDDKLYSHIYKAEPGDFPMKSGVTIRMKFPEDSVDVRKLGVYFRVGRGGWAFMNNKIDWSRKEVTGRALSLETFAIRIDDVPPITEIRSPRRNAYVSPRPRIVAYARDRESRFASEESLVLKIDGKKVIATYDPEHGTVTYVPKSPLSRGTHSVEFSATDRAGNTSSRRTNFLVN